MNQDKMNREKYISPTSSSVFLEIKALLCISDVTAVAVTENYPNDFDDFIW